MPDRKKKLKHTSPSTERGGHPDEPKKKLYDVSFFYAWCKACGLCEAFCPKKIIRTDKTGRPEIIDTDRCTGCRFCEKHCPDFAITVDVKMPRRRKTDG
ncbi:MAG: 4Fe-4S binding protein [Desulfobulbaceae bacterium]|nr:4Fe-4S binding protein [Desulfobulbaceae bacterium]